MLAPFERDLVYRLAPGREFVLFLGRDRRPGEYRLTDETVLPYDESLATGSAERSPCVPAWSDASAGLASIVVPDHEPSIADAA